MINSLYSSSKHAAEQLSAVDTHLSESLRTMHGMAGKLSNVEVAQEQQLQLSHKNLKGVQQLHLDSQQVQAKLAHALQNEELMLLKQSQVLTNLASLDEEEAARAESATLRWQEAQEQAAHLLEQQQQYQQVQQQLLGDLRLVNPYASLSPWFSPRRCPQHTNAGMQMQMWQSTWIKSDKSKGGTKSQRKQANLCCQTHVALLTNSGDVKCRQLSDNSAGLRTALDVVVQYEQRGAAMLTHMLGSTYGVQDLMAYALAALGIAATCLSKGLRAARLPLVGLFALAVVGERAVMHSFHHLLEVDPTGQVGCCLGS
ncbi:hypothetical protein ABBQ38_012392 [Trebouxia sp. C0009 RCD-2024]